jgi:hypothetical protein
MPDVHEVYQVRNADNVSALGMNSIEYPCTDAGLREALESARERSLSGAEQVVVDLSMDTMMARYKDGVRI